MGPVNDSYRSKMMIYGYVAKNCQTPEILSAAIQQYCRDHRLALDKVIVDYENNGACWEERRLYDLIKSQCQSGDTVVVYDALSLGRSVSRVIDVITTLSQQRVSIHFVKYNMMFVGQTLFDSLDVMRLIMQFESDVIVKCTADEMLEQPGHDRSSPAPNSKAGRLLKLDKYRATIQHYLNIGISKAAIARITHCHPQTLRHYIDLRQLKSQWYVV